MKRAKNKRQMAKIVTLVFSFVVVPTVLLLLALPPAIAQTAKHYTELTFPPLPEIQIPEYTKFQTKNGITVFLMEDHELPLVGGTAMFQTGERFEPEAKVGLASITGEVLRTGGTKSRSADQLNQELEQRAASVEAGVGTTSGQASFSALSEDLEAVFGLFAEVVQEPVFAQEKIDLAKTQRRGAIARRNDQPESIVGREFNKLIYGEESPYARTVEYSTLSNISREDIVRFYQQYFHPNNMLLGIVGDFDSKKMRSLIEAKLGQWQPAPGFKTPGLQAVSQAKTGGIFLVNQPHLSQSYIQMGHLGGQLDSPDYPALSVMNEVLSSFGGRLFNEVRSRQGLAYSVYGVWNPRYDYPGVFIAGGQTRSDATVPFIKSIFSEIQRIQTTPISEQELKAAKDSVLNSFVFNFRDPGQTLSRLMRYTYFGYPEDFIFRYQRGVEATTVADVQRVAQTYLKPDQVTTLVVGNAAAIQPPLSSLGSDIQVAEIDITIPQPEPVQGNVEPVKPGSAQQ
jgi:zinc protease